MQAQGQTNESSDKKAIKLVDKANEQVKSRAFYEAVENYKKAIARDPGFANAYLKLANLQAFLGEADNAYVQYKNYYVAVDKNTLRPKMARGLSYRFFNGGEYGLASEAFDHYLSGNGNKLLELKDSTLQQSIAMGLAAKESPRRMEIIPLSDSVNRFMVQYFPVLTIDNNYIYFTKRDGLQSIYDEDIMMAVRENGEWSKAKSISKHINTEYNEGACTVSADGNTLIFTACEGRQSFGNCDLFVSYFRDNDWTKPQNLGSNINSAYWDSQPSLSADGQTLYFSSNRPGGKGKRDIWVAFKEKGVWQKPQNLGESINTPEDETTPFIHVNGESLFFASMGHPGLGGYDIYLSEQGNGKWSKPRNLGFPINDHNDQSSLFITSDGKGAYFTNEDEKGSYLYQFRLILGEDSLVSRKATYLTGTIKDSETKLPVKATFLLYDLKTQEKLYETQSADESGRYFLSLKADGTYGGYVTADGYLFEDFTFDLKSTYSLKPDTLDIFLKPLKEGEKVVLENIYFDFDSYELLPESISELKTISEFISRNRLTVEIGGHTDQVGNREYNNLLSENRARAVYDFLIGDGVSADQLTYKGYGASVPLFSDAENGKIDLNRRIEFKIIQYDGS